MKHLLKSFLTVIFFVNAIYAVSEFKEPEKKPALRALMIAPSLVVMREISLEDAAKAVIKAGADRIHIDIDAPTSDINFNGLRSVCGFLPLDVHLLRNLPKNHIKLYEAATTISIPIAPVKELKKKLLFIKALRCKAGVVLNPDQPIDSIAGVLSIVDHVIVMGVKPGACGQSFIPATLGKIMELTMRRRSLRLNFLIMVDGGVKPEFSSLFMDLKVDVLIACSSIFKKSDYRQAILDLRFGCDDGL